jgi:hypothetical protein
MAPPNLKSPATITGKTELAALTTSLASVLSNAASSGKVLKVNTIRAANIAADQVTVDVAVVRSSTTVYLIKGAVVGAGKTLITTDKNEYIYLEEGDAIHAKSSAATSIDLTINYEEIN